MFYSLKNYFLLVLLCVNGVGAAQVYSAFNIPDSLLKNANAVVRHSQTNVVVKSNTATLSKEETITILNSTKDNLAEVTIRYDKLQKIKSFKAELYDKLGNKIKQFDKRDASDYSVAGNTLGDEERIKFWSLKGATFPYTIHYTYEVEFLSLFHIQNWTPVPSIGVSVEKATLQIINNDVQVNHKSQWVQQISNSHGEYQWELAAFKAIQQQPFLPNHFKLLPYVLLSAEAFELYGVKGSLKTWNEYSHFIYQLNQNRENLDDVSIPEIDTVIRSLKTKEEKVQFLYRYLQNNYRYVSIQMGIGGWQSQTAKYTLQKKFGDCKALVTLMMGLLKREGIPSYMALVNADENRIDIQPDFVHSQFNHVILCVPNLLDTIWLECTSQNDPYNYLGSFTEGRSVLVVCESGGRIQQTPLYTEKTNSSCGSTTVKFAEDGSCILSLDIVFSGEKQDRLRSLHFESDKKKLQLAATYEMDMSNAKQLTFNITHIDTLLPKLHIVSSYCDNSTMRKTATRIMIRPSLLDPFKGFSDKTDTRTQPFTVSEGISYWDTLTFEIPPQFIPENFKTDAHNAITSKFGAASFSIAYNHSLHQLVIYRNGYLKEQAYPSSDYKTFVQFMLDAENIYAPQLVLKRTE